MNKQTLIAALAAATPFVYAADAPSTPLEPVFVTATRLPVAEDDVLSATLTITREEIERAQANDLAQLLAVRAGLDVGRTGGPGQPASVFIRGGNSDHTLVLIDGVRVNPATSGPALALISPDMIERIEIVKGPRSTLYGSDALAGVINIITRTPQGTRFGAKVRAGSHGTHDYGASTAFGDEHARFAVTATKNHVDGLPSFVGATEDRGYDLTTFALRGEGAVGAVKLNGQVWRAEGSNEYANTQLAFGGPPDFATTLVGFDLRDHDTLNQTAALAAQVSPLSNWDVRLQLAHTTDDLRENQNTDRVRTQRPEWRLDNILRLGEQRLSAGVSLAQDRVDYSRGFDSYSDVRTLGAAYAQGELVYGRNHAVAGASLNRYEGFESEPTYSVEYGFDAWSGGRLVASYGTGFRAPNANQRFSLNGGNPDLKPERSRSYEAGVQQRYGAHRVDLRAFQNKVNDLIGFDSFFTAVNIDRAKTQGLELGYVGRFGALEARVEGVLQKVECTVDASGFDGNSCKAGKRLVRRNTRSVSGALSYQFARGYLGVDAFGAGDRRDFQGLPPFSNDVKDAGYALFNASAGVTLGHGFALALRGENLLDQRYTTADGYRQPGASAYASLRYDWVK